MTVYKILRVVARALMGSTYAVLGAEAMRNPGTRVEQAASTLAALRTILPLLPTDDELTVRGNAAMQAVGGTLMAAGVFPKTAALGLAASMIPTTLAGHAFWSTSDPAARKAQRVQFLKNMGMLGGLLFAVLGEYRAAPGLPTH